LQQPGLEIRWHSRLACEHRLEPQPGSIPADRLAEAEAFCMGGLDGVGQCDRDRLLHPYRWQRDGSGLLRHLVLRLDDHPAVLTWVRAGALAGDAGLARSLTLNLSGYLTLDLSRSKAHVGRSEAELAGGLRLHVRPARSLRQPRAIRVARSWIWLRAGLETARLKAPRLETAGLKAGHRARSYTVLPAALR
jgi:hypothetical protein